jgi:hypothetical protein
MQKRSDNVGLNRGTDTLDIRDRCRSTCSGLAAGMMTDSHVAIASHFSAASHFGLSHIVRRKTSERGHGRPQEQQNERKDRTALRHSLMLHLQSVAGKEACIPACPGSDFTLASSYE